MEAIGVAQRMGEKSQRWILLILLILAYAVYNLDKNVIAILIEPLKAEFGMTDSQVGLLTGLASTAPFALVCIPVGMLADRVNRKRLLIVLMVGWSIMTGMAGFATVVAMLFISRIGTGAFEGGFTPVSLSLVADSFPRERRSSAMGLYGLGAPVGVFMGLGLGAIVAAEHGWRAAFFLAGLPGLVIAALVLMVVSNPVRGRYDAVAEVIPNPGILAVLVNVGRDPALLNLVLGLVLCAVPQAALAIWTPSFLVRVHGMELKEAGLTAAMIVGFFGAAGAAMSGFIGDLLGRLAPWRRLYAPMIGVSFAVLSILAGTVWATGFWPSVAFLASASFFGQWYSGVGYGEVSNRAPVNMRAATLSVLLVGFNLGAVSLGSSVVGIVSDLVPIDAPIAGLSIGLAAAGLFGFWGVAHFLFVQRLYRLAPLHAGQPG